MKDENKKRTPREIEAEIEKLQKELEESKRIIPKMSESGDVYIGDLRSIISKGVEAFYLGNGPSLYELSEETLSSIAYHAATIFYKHKDIEEFIR
jgi:hypothetical protein